MYDSGPDSGVVPAPLPPPLNAKRLLLAAGGVPENEGGGLLFIVASCRRPTQARRRDIWLLGDCFMWRMHSPSRFRGIPSSIRCGNNNTNRYCRTHPSHSTPTRLRNNARRMQAAVQRVDGQGEKDVCREPLHVHAPNQRNAASAHGRARCDRRGHGHSWQDKRGQPVAHVVQESTKSHSRFRRRGGGAEGYSGDHRRFALGVVHRGGHARDLMLLRPAAILEILAGTRQASAADFTRCLTP